MCFRLSHNCTELAQNWERPWKELYRGYKPTESKFLGWWFPSTLQPFVPVLPPTEVAELGTISVLPTRGMQLRTGCPSNCTHGHEPKRSDRGRVVGQQLHCSATLSTQHRIGVLDGCKDLCQQRSKLAGKTAPKMNKIIWEEQPGRGRLRSGYSKPTQHLPESPQVQLHPGDEITALRLRHQAGGMKVAGSTELTLHDPRVSASLLVLCTFLSIHELQPELSETLVSGTQQGRCKINRIWSAARDLTRLQRLWYSTEAQNKNQLLL